MHASEVNPFYLSSTGVIDRQTIDGLTQKVEDAVIATFTDIMNEESSSPSRLLHRLNFPSSGVVEHLVAAEVFEQAVELIHANASNSSRIAPGGMVPTLSACEVAVLATLSGCQTHIHTANCSDVDYHEQYRSIDGTCNNAEDPLWGAADVPYVRLLPPAYEDGVGLPRGWSGTLPSARLISQWLLSAAEVEHSTVHTHMLMQFGQFLDHDLVLTPSSASDIVFLSGESCENTCENNPPCFPIPVSPCDARITRPCIPFTRSAAVCGSGASSLLIGPQAIHREQLNSITSYIDASMVYGSNETTARQLRHPGGGGRLLMSFGVVRGGKPILPFTQRCVGRIYGSVRCRDLRFVTGDERANQQVIELASFQFKGQRFLQIHSTVTIRLILFSAFTPAYQVYLSPFYLLHA